MSDEFFDSDNGEEESFADLFESFDAGMKEDVQVGEKIKGEIISIGKDSVFVDTGTKVDGVIDVGELLDENQQMPYQEGDVVELYAVSVKESEIRLSKALSGHGDARLLEEAFENAIPVEGRVKEQRKGGFGVEIMQRNAFCPISQIDLRFAEKPEDYVGEVYQFLITQFEEDGRNIVVSRRKLLSRELEKEKDKFYEGIAIGVRLEGSVTRLMPYGAFVELFPGIEGLVHISEVSWSRVEKPDDILGVGDLVNVQVIGIEQGEGVGSPKIALSIKQVEGDPWEGVTDKFHADDKVAGRVTRCAKFGAFVEIAPGIEGLVHISEMSYQRRVLRPEEIVRSGEDVQVVIKEIDPVKKRISLSIKDAEGDPWAYVEEKYPIGGVREGVLEKKEKFGYFITLEPGITGLLPLSMIRNADTSALIEKTREGSTLAVIIKEIDLGKRRITLAPGNAGDEMEWRSFTKDSKKPLGAFGEKLQQALKSKTGK